MRKAYIAPDCEYMTFTVDDLIAAACYNDYRDMGGRRFQSGESCNINNPIGSGTLFSAVPNCDSVTTDYCYVTAGGTGTIFGS